jgi:hypothetical protein
MHAEIFQPAKSTMQSGRAKSKKWHLKFTTSRPRRIENLMGYAGAGNPERQLSLSFSTLEEAKAYAEAKNIDYQVREPKVRKMPIKSYSDNFKAVT